jgi:transposase
MSAFLQAPALAFPFDTGSYGAGLTRFIERSGVAILEINRPNRSRRRNRGKSDPTDAESAARAFLADDATGGPRAQSGLAEALRTLTSLVAAPSKPRPRL